MASKPFSMMASPQGKPTMTDQSFIKPAEGIAKARIAGQLAARVLQMIEPHVQPGVTTDHLDQLCHDFIVNELQAIPANIGYHGYEKTTCISVNHVICHGIPSEKVLKKGDIVNVDVALIKDGWYGDTSRMFYAGEPSILARRLVDTHWKPCSPALTWCAPAPPWVMSVLLSPTWRSAKGSQ